MPDSEAALFYINDLAQVGGAAAGTTGTATELSAKPCADFCGPAITAAHSLVDLANSQSVADTTEQASCCAGADDMPRIPTATYKAKISAVHVVAKGRQGVEAANSVQVRRPHLNSTTTMHFYT